MFITQASYKVLSQLGVCMWYKFLKFNEPMRMLQASKFNVCTSSRGYFSVFIMHKYNSTRCVE